MFVCLLVGWLVGCCWLLLVVVGCLVCLFVCWLVGWLVGTTIGCCCWRGCSSHDIENIPTTNKKLPTTRKTFLRHRNGSSHVIGTTIKLWSLATLFGPPGARNGQKGSPEWSCYVTHVQSATEWTASVHTSHMSKAVM